MRSWRERLAAWLLAEAPACPECRARAGAEPRSVEVPLVTMREQIDRAWWLLELPEDWIENATTDHVRALAGAVACEVLLREGAWATVEAGGWPE